MSVIIRAGRFTLGAIVAWAVVSSPILARANATNSSLSLNATISPTISIQPVVIPPISNNTTTSSVVTVNLPVGNPFSIALTGGNSGNCDTRTLTDGLGHSVPYQLYVDPAHTQVWCGGPTGAPITGVGTGVNQPLSFYIVVTPNGSPAGSYSDALIATIGF